MEIEDSGSTGGTYINNEKITVGELKNRQTLNFAKFLEFNVLAGPENEKSGGVLLSGENGHYLILHSNFSLGFKANKLTVLQPQLEIYYKNPVPVLIWENGYFILEPGQKTETPVG